jgi:hypothetical protein
MKRIGRLKFLKREKPGLQDRPVRVRSESPGEDRICDPFTAQDFGK